MFGVRCHVPSSYMKALDSHSWPMPSGFARGVGTPVTASRVADGEMHTTRHRCVREMRTKSEGERLEHPNRRFRMKLQAFKTKGGPSMSGPRAWLTPALLWRVLCSGLSNCGRS